MTERKSKNIFLIGYIVLTITVLLVMSSCGSSSKEYHIGTGQELSRSNCSGNYINR